VAMPRITTVQSSICGRCITISCAASLKKSMQRQHWRCEVLCGGILHRCGSAGWPCGCAVVALQNGILNCWQCRVSGDVSHPPMDRARGEQFFEA
jgi:hypothetical protein